MQVRTWMFRMPVMLFAFVLLLSVVMTGTYAWQGQQQVLNSAYGMKAEMFPVELIKLEKQIDGTETETPIADTVFYLYRENGEQVGGRYITDDNGKISVQLSEGSYYFEETSPSIGYTYDTDGNGEDIKRYEFTVDKNDEEILVKAYNKRLTGALLISKRVQNADETPLSEAQKSEAFQFKVTFSDKGSYPYKIDGGSELLLESGESLNLCDGQEAVFENLPAGITYDVTEKPAEGYTMTSSGSSGSVPINDIIKAEFTNIYEKEPLPEDTVKLSVEKKLAGEVKESDKDREFEMILTVDGKVTVFSIKAGENKEFEIPAGSVYEVREEDYTDEGFHQSIVNGYGTAHGESIDVVVTNTYVGTPLVEITGQKKWDLNGCEDVKLPESITVRLMDDDRLVEEQTVMPDADGLWMYCFDVPKYDDEGEQIEYNIDEIKVPGFNTSYDGHDITNTYIKPAEVDPPIITKVVKGENAPTTVFEFVFEGLDNAPMPEGTDGSKKILALAGGGEIEIGTIKYDRPGTYKYTVHEKDGGLHGWEYDTGSYIITVTVKEKDNALIAEKTVVKGDKKADKPVFTNTYDSSCEETVVVSGMKTWKHGSNPENKRPEAIIVKVYGDGQLSLQRQITGKDKWCYSFELPRFDEDGDEIDYTVDEAYVSGYKKTINGYDITNTFIGSSPAGEDADDDPKDKDNTKDKDSDGLSGSDKDDGSGKTKTAKTGDSSNLILWFVLMMISMIGIILTLRKKQVK